MKLIALHLMTKKQTFLLSFINILNSISYINFFNLFLKYISKIVCI